MDIHLPREIIDTITFFVVEADRRRHPYLNENTWRCKGTSPEYRQGLAALRLVSKSFNRSASPPFFRHFNATVGMCSHSRPLENLFNLSNSGWAAYVRNLEVGFRLISEPDQQFLLRAVEDLAGILPACLARFTNLKALHFNFQVPRCPRRPAEIFRDTVITALRYTPLPNLTEMDIVLPIAYDFGLLLDNKSTRVRIPVKHVVRRLRNLSLCLSEWTSLQDQRDWFRPVYPENAALPNTTHGIKICKMVELAENLESLAIDSKDIIDIDGMNLHKSIRLRLLSLERVSISAHVLISLIDQCEDTLTSIDLCRVELLSGKWHQVLVRISRLPNLLIFWIDSSGYSRYGANRNWHVPPPTPCEDIEGDNSLDKYALGNVQRQVNTNRLAAGLSQIPVSQYRRIQLQPLEDRIDQMTAGQA